MTEFTFPFDDQVETGVYVANLNLSDKTVGALVSLDFDCWVNNVQLPPEFEAIKTNDEYDQLANIPPLDINGVIYYNPGEYDWNTRVQSNMSIMHKPRVNISCNGQLLSTARRSTIPYLYFTYLVTQDMIDHGLDIEIYMYAHSTYTTWAWMSTYTPDPVNTLTATESAKLDFCARVPITVDGATLVGRIAVCPDGYKMQLLDSTGAVIPSSSTKYLTITAETAYLLAEVEPDNISFYALNEVYLLDGTIPELPAEFVSAESVVIPETFTYDFLVEPSSTDEGPQPEVPMMMSMMSGDSNLISPVVIYGTDSATELAVVTTTPQLHQVLISPATGSPVTNILSHSQYTLSVVDSEISITLKNDFIAYNNKLAVILVRVGQQFAGSIPDPLINLDGETYIICPVTLNSLTAATPATFSFDLANYFPEATGTFDFTVKFNLPATTEISIESLYKLELGEMQEIPAYIPEGTVFYTTTPLAIRASSSDYKLKVTRTLVSSNNELVPDVTTYHETARISTGSGVTLFRFEQSAEVQISALSTFVLQNPSTGNLDMPAVDVLLTPYGSSTLPEPFPEPELM